MTRVVIEITDHDGASTDFKTMTVNDEFSSENEKRWMKILAESFISTLRRMKSANEQQMNDKQPGATK